MPDAQPAGSGGAARAIWPTNRRSLSCVLSRRWDPKCRFNLRECAVMPTIVDLARQLLRLRCRELLISRIDLLGGASLRIETRLMRPNGTYIDLFIEFGAMSRADLPGTIRVSDFGSTWDYAFDAANPISDSSLTYIAECYDVQLYGRALSKSCTIDDFLPSVLALAQACLALSGAVFDRAEISQISRHRDIVSLPAKELANLPVAARSGTFMTVIDTLNRSHREFEMSALIPLAGYEVEVDILVRTKRLPAALMIVEHSPYEKVTMRRADHAFAIFTDLKDARWRGTLYSVVDQEDVERDYLTDSFQRLGRISKLITASNFPKENLEMPN